MDLSTYRTVCTIKKKKYFIFDWPIVRQLREESRILLVERTKFTEIFDKFRPSVVGNRNQIRPVDFRTRLIIFLSKIVRQQATDGWSGTFFSFSFYKPTLFYSGMRN